MRGAHQGRATIALRRLHCIATITNTSAVRRLTRCVNIRPTTLSTAIRRCGGIYTRNCSDSFTGSPRFLGTITGTPFCTRIAAPDLNFTLIAANNFIAAGSRRILGRSCRPVRNLCTSNGAYNVHFNPRCVAPVPNIDVNVYLALNHRLNGCLTTGWTILVWV